MDVNEQEQDEEYYDEKDQKKYFAEYEMLCPKSTKVKALTDVKEEERPEYVLLSYLVHNKCQYNFLEYETLKFQ